jgi:hypothetical protein
VSKESLARTYLDGHQRHLEHAVAVISLQQLAEGDRVTASKDMTRPEVQVRGDCSGRYITGE